MTSIQNSLNNQSDKFTVNTGDLTITTGAVQGNAQVLFNSAVFTQFQANQANINLDFKTVTGTGDVVFTPNATDALYVSHLGTGRVGLGNGQGTPTAIADIAASTTSNASARIRVGVAPTSPNDGDIWYDGASILARVNGANAPLGELLATVTGINGKTIANTALYTVPTGKTAIITAYTVRVSASSSIATGAAAGIGNVAGTNNISASQAMNTLTATTTTFVWPIAGISIASAAASIIYFNIGTGASGTSQTLVVDLLGYLV